MKSQKMNTKYQNIYKRLYEQIYRARRIANKDFGAINNRINRENLDYWAKAEPRFYSAVVISYNHR